ncbi:hypothetical protein AX16_010509 [Volvariella volvacea WC 439]|nr:hypothetical protein AX16_010509 [Volvariella volvacea WC 439]
MLTATNSSYPLNDSEESEHRPPETPQNRRHGAPAGPWPWINFSDRELQTRADNAQHIPECPPNCVHFDCGRSWRNYPTNLFPNWSKDQVKRSGITKAIRESFFARCSINIVDVFKQSRSFDGQARWEVQNGREKESWDQIQQKRSSDVRVRALFLNRPTGDALQMIGTKYKIEPFFFSSALNRIPTRYQEEARQRVGDHLTIILPFMRLSHYGSVDKAHCLRLSTVTLSPDLLALHIIRDSSTGTIISYHPESDSYDDGAEHLLARVIDAGESVYWQDIFRNTSSSIFVVLIYLWYVLYAWDEALEELFKFISELESQSINSEDIRETKILHNIRAHLLQYTALLRNFELSVQFLRDTRNPAGQAHMKPQESELLIRECTNLLGEIERLEMARDMHNKRLKNVMNLAFSTVAIRDSSQMRQLTENAANDSRAMKQIAILTMIFLPPSFAAGIFGMNITSLDNEEGIRGQLWQYFATAVPLTILTIWVIVASQQGSPGSDVASKSAFDRLAWPFRLVRRVATESVVAPSRIQSQAPSQAQSQAQSRAPTLEGSKVLSRRETRIATDVEMGKGQGNDVHHDTGTSMQMQTLSGGKSPVGSVRINPQGQVYPPMNQG